jgi:hypothetical protein
MQEDYTEKLCCSDIGCHGRPIDHLTREELLEAFLEFAQTVVSCASTNNQCKAIFSVNQE